MSSLLWFILRVICIYIYIYWDTHILIIRPCLRDICILSNLIFVTTCQVLCCLNSYLQVLALAGSLRSYFRYFSYLRIASCKVVIYNYFMLVLIPCQSFVPCIYCRIYLYGLCVCVCVCVRERERERLKTQANWRLKCFRG